MLSDEDTLDALDTLLHVLFTLQSQIKSSSLITQQFNQLNLTQNGATEDNKSLNFWSQFQSLIKDVSKQSTTFAMAFDKPPFAIGEAAKKLCEQMQHPFMAISQLLHQHLQHARETYGMLCLGEHMTALGELVRAVSDLVIAVKSLKNSKQLQSTGTAWELCDKMLQLPINNKDTMLICAQKTKELVNDALVELEQGAQLLQDYDAKILTAALALVKCSKATVCKIHSCVQTTPFSPDNKLSINELDQMGITLEKLSPAIDDLAVEIYEIQEREDGDKLPENNIIGEAENLGNVIERLLDLLLNSVWAGENDKERIEFLRKVPKHNVEKLKELLK